MSPSMFSAVATRWFVHRWWFFAASLFGIAAVLALAWLGALRVAGTLAGPAVMLPWAMFCTCIWFHPQRGNLQPSSQFFGKLPAVLQSGLRWYVALFLSFFVLLAVVVWPALALTGF